MKTLNDTHNPPAVHFDGVRLSRGTREIIRGITWSVAAGEFAAILGPNGSGKSTLARMLLGYLWATRGRVTVAGRVFGETNLHTCARSSPWCSRTASSTWSRRSASARPSAPGVGGTLGAYRPPPWSRKREWTS